MDFNTIPQEHLKKLLRYDPETGVFTWINRAGKQHSGTRAGTTNAKSQYTVITIEGKKYSAHRLAWLYVHGEMPECDIDHRNRRRGDDRISNLRKATVSQNRQNVTKPQSNGSSGHRGVSKRPNSNNWRARINIQGIVYQSWHATKEEAAAAYLELKAIHHPFFTTIN